MTEHKVWVISYSDRSGIVAVYDNEKMAGRHLEISQGGIKEEFMVRTKGDFDND